MTSQLLEGRHRRLSSYAHRIPDGGLVTAGWIVGLLSLTAILGGVLVLVRDRPVAPIPWGYSVAESLGYVGVPVVGVMIVSRMPRHRYGWVWLGMGAALAVIGATGPTYWLLPSFEPPAWVLELAVGWAFVAMLVLISLVFLLFPDGKLPSARWRWVLTVAVTAGAVGVLAMPFTTPESGAATPWVVQGGAGRWFASALNAAVIALFVVLVVSTVAVPVRWRQADPAEKQQLKWFAFGAVWFALGTPVTAFLDFLFPLWVDAAVFSSMFVALEVAVAVAMLRYRLYDVDRVINRALLFAGLSACLLAVYIAVVAVTPVLLPTDVPDLGQAIATAAVALLVLPLRARLQRWINRLTFGRRGDPYEVLADLGRRLEASAAAETVLARIAESVAVTLRLPYVAIDLHHDEGFTPGASYGQSLLEPVTFPLTHQGQAVGRLLASPRSPGEDLTRTDRRLLTDLARHAGVAAHAVLLEDDLRRSRARVLATREEERRRLRRDLHDGLGPTLAAVGLGLETAKRRCQDDPDRAAALLERLSTDVQSTIGDVRRLVHDLRPPILDQYGLVDAIRAEARRFETEAAADANALTIHVDAPLSAPPLSAAVEVAAYRITAEALTNVVKHADAQRCVVRLGFDDFVELDIHDNGRGLPSQHRRGVGLSSMAERAAEVGGCCEVAITPLGGTRVHARLPLEVLP
jgi:signal transduction histidine kinase